MRFLKQSAAVTVQVGPYLDSTDGVTAETALSPTVEVSKAGAAFAARNSATAITHDADGWYRVELDATDTATVGPLVLKGTEAGALPVWHDFMILPANVYDSLVGGTDTLQADVTQFGGSNGTFAAGRPEVNATHWGGTAVASANVLIDGAITAAKIATDAIDADAIAASAVTEIQSGLATAAALATVDGNVDAILVDTGTDIPATLATIAGYIDTEIGTIITHLTDIKGATWSSLTDSLEAIRDRGDAAWITATGFSTHSAADVWSVATRVLTAGTNIALAKGIGVTGFNDLDAAGIRSAVGLASANLDTQLSTINTVVNSILADTGTDGVVVAAGSKTGYSLTSTGLDSVVLPANIITAPSLAADAVTEITSSVLTTQMTESYRGAGAAPTLAQAQFELIAHMGEASINSTTKTLKKLDGSTTAKTYTLNDATTPTSITETT